MSFFSKKTSKTPSHGQKIPPVGAWGHYNKKQGNKTCTQGNEGNKTPLINVNALSLAYEGRSVIENLSFSVCEGDYLCVIGENGSGKSTLMNALLGIIKPTSGKITFHHLSRNRIGVLPQQTPVQNDFPATVFEVVMAGCLARNSKGPFLSKDARNIAFSNMEKLGITALSDRPFRELSGGQRQRVLIARALCAADKALVLDEPVTGLDPVTTADIYALFRDLNRAGMTVISVTHDVHAAMKYATHILRVNKSSVFFGTIDEYAALPEAARYLIDENEVTTAEKPYGEGGFRYNGGDSSI